MVYGEYAQEAAVELCKLLASQLPTSLEVTYLTNSGTEAIEGWSSKRATGREEFIAAHQAYHGSTQGALSLLGVEAQKKATSLLPKVNFIQFNAKEELDKITTKTAAVVLETIKGAGLPESGYLKAVKARCEAVERFWYWTKFNRELAAQGVFSPMKTRAGYFGHRKRIRGGLPIGAFCSSKELMEKLTHSPALGHWPFGGNPVTPQHMPLSTVLKKDSWTNRKKKPCFGVCWFTRKLRCPRSWTNVSAYASPRGRSWESSEQVVKKKDSSFSSYFGRNAPFASLPHSPLASVK